MRRVVKAIFIIILTAALACPLAACGAKEPPPCLSATKFLLNTTCTISLYDRQDQKVLDEAFALCSRYDRLFSMTVKGSDIYRINHAGGTPVKVDPDTIDVIKESEGYSEASNGLFDITIGALSSLWNIESDHPKVPAKGDIEAAVKTIDYRDIVLSGNTVKLKNKDTMLDLGGVAKGYIADQLKAFLLSRGVHRAIINLGGNVLTLGAKAAGTPWVVGVQQPFMDKNTDIGYLYVTDQSVVTSGIYERYFVQDGRLYAHILDPRTGYPVDNNLSSVTIISDDSKDGDGLSATCFLLGIEKAKQLIGTRKDTEAIFITKDGQVFTTPGINKKVKFVPASAMK